MFIQNICTNLFSLVQRDLAFLLENLAHFFAEKVFSNTTAGKLSEKNCALVVQPILEEERKKAAQKKVLGKCSPIFSA